eukprot:TRINITY_DN4901_c0_g2_i1.p2 TRINITY_DN4901_c0_g2~~TRINITY_DN4901_c0_g2_i1.p2  ORF type:complete len:128 (-),score=3.17 TRINITY_DN4901_c0_g2_i1:17-400(-)
MFVVHDLDFVWHSWVMADDRGRDVVDVALDRCAFSTFCWSIALVMFGVHAQSRIRLFWAVHCLVHDVLWVSGLMGFIRSLITHRVVTEIQRCCSDAGWACARATLLPNGRFDQSDVNVIESTTAPKL